MMITIESISALNQPHVRIRNKEELLRKINKLITDGKNNLQIVTDFDCTLTKQRLDDGKTPLTSFGMLRECPSTPQYYKDEDIRCAQIYKPIESDPNLTVEEKTKHMIEWYIAANKMLRNMKFPHDELKEIARGMSKDYREGINELINWSVEHKVPLLVFSAGLGEAVVCALEEANFMHDNVKVISNFLEMDENSIVTGIKGEIIHTFNKNEAAIKNTEYYTMVKDRSNVILMGDSIGDAKMTDGMEHCDAIIKIAFLYHNAEANVESYQKQFDIVLIDDQTLDVTNSLLKLIK